MTKYILPGTSKQLLPVWTDSFLTFFGYRTWRRALQEAYWRVWSQRSDTVESAIHGSRPLWLQGDPAWYIPWKLVLFLRHNEYRHVGRIMSLLAPYSTYEGWVCCNHPAVCTTMTPKDFRQGRLQWLAHLIKECDDKP